MPPARLRPLLPRPGARFTCAGDGLCCADAHLLGPISPREARALRADRPGCTTREHALVLLRTSASSGACTFLSEDARCSIHTSVTKPRTCHRYPYLLVATPDGGRVGTDHRCPCRTMGARALLRGEDAEPSLRDSAGRLASDHRIDGVVPLAPGRALSWPEWRAHEASLLTRLASGELPERVLDARPFPPLGGGESWLGIGLQLAADERPMRWARANQWAGDAIAALHGRPPILLRPRPWSDAFDRAEARTPTPEPTEPMLADWIADIIWTLEWTLHGDFERACTELATRLAVARWIAARLESEGARPDRAFAEAIAIAEIVGLSETWVALFASSNP